ncbi:MAG TPA: hypothetical protein VMD53_00775 [Rhizomicrobium sp.]|nr:hypothetical protein [Rhizomicrobium sp.]
MAIAYGEKRTIVKAEGTGSAVEAAAGIAIAVLAIIGLSRGTTGSLTSIATIILGAAMFVFGATMATEYSKVVEAVGEGAIGASEFGAGISVEIMTGGTAIVLGILGLIGVGRAVLIPAAVITVGAGLILSAGSFQRLNNLRMQVSGLADFAQALSRAAVTSALTSQVLAGLAAIVLGILALSVPGSSGSLMQVGLIVLGVALAMSGTALTGRVLRLFSPGTPTA